MSIFKKFAGGKKRKHGNAKPDMSLIEGVITFFGAHHALKGEMILSKNGIIVLLVPGPREISPNCGTALRFDYTRKEEVVVLLEQNNVLFEKIHYYPA